MEFTTMGVMTGPLEPINEGGVDDEKIVHTPGYGENVCKKLKEIRDEEAKKHNVDYKSAPCWFMDTCDRPCSKCEEEAQWLYQLIYKKEE